MSKAIVEELVLGMVSTNTWFCQNSGTRELFIIDPADEAERIVQKVTGMEGKPMAVLLTHGHFDHMMAAKALREYYKIPILACVSEKELLNNAGANLSGSWAKACTLQADQWLSDKEKIEIAGFSIEVLHTPGHTGGSCCFYLPDENLLFSGDTLFAGSVGRTDFPTSSGRQMIKSLHMLLDTLPQETRVCPGHGEETTIAYEKRYNPFA